MMNSAQLRTCEDWKKQGLTLSTSSNEAARLFDAAVNQYVGMYDDKQFGGLRKTIELLHEADPNFVMGHVISNALSLISMTSSTTSDVNLQKALSEMRCIATSSPPTTRELLHVKAVEFLGSRDLRNACDVWEEILLDYPHDALAIKLVQDGYYHLGEFAQLRDCIARILPEWSTTMPQYGFLLGQYSFGLCETGNYSQAGIYARKALEFNRRDSWSTHSLAHVFEMTGQADAGLEFLNKTVSDWENSYLACHIHWHSSVYHVEKGDYADALELYDNLIATYAKTSKHAFNISDASSLLYRLNLEGVDVGKRWDELYETCIPHLDDHLSTFYDMHYLMAFLGAEQKKLVNNFLSSCETFACSGMGFNQPIMKSVGLPLFEALIAYDEKNFAAAVDKLLPLKYSIVRGDMSGSAAQRDVLMQTLIQAALKSSNARHRLLAGRLLAERKALKEDSPLTDRLLLRLNQ